MGVGRQAWNVGGLTLASRQLCTFSGESPIARREI